MKAHCLLLLLLIVYLAYMPNQVLGQGKCEEQLSACNREKVNTQNRYSNCLTRERRQKQRADDAETQVGQLQSELSITKSNLVNETTRANTEKARADSEAGKVRQLQSDLSVTKTTLTGETARANSEKTRADSEAGKVRQLQTDLSITKSSLASETTRANTEKARADSEAGKVRQLQSDLITEKAKAINDGKRTEEKIKELERKIPKVVISKIWVDHNVKKEEVAGMIVHVSFNAYNLMSAECKMAIYFYTKNGIALEDKNGIFKTADGKVAHLVDFKPTYIRSQFSDFQIFIPYNELHQSSGKNELKFLLHPYRKGVETEFFDKSDYYPFTMTVP